VSGDAVISARGARRWSDGHPWIFRSDVQSRPNASAGIVSVCDARGEFKGWALWSPTSEISLRLLDASPDARIDDAWWHARLSAAITRRAGLSTDTNACRLVHGEGDGIPSLIVDRYDRWLVVQLLSAGLESVRATIVSALCDLLRPAGVLARNDAGVREREGLPRLVEPLYESVPATIEVREHGVRYLAAPRDGQKTGAFLDQRENRRLIGSLARGRALDCFTYHGSFALHLAQRAREVKAVDASGAALGRAHENGALNALTNITFVEADAFDFLRSEEWSGARYDTIVLDPPAFAKSRATLPGALRGYHEINLRAMRLLAPGGVLFTASCSYHVGRAAFLEMLRGAAHDSGRLLAIRAFTGQPLDHPELLTVPETGYLKGALLTAE
jgi:23S rRNA (cytosine1962-C5)-methyltransferase